MKRRALALALCAGLLLPCLMPGATLANAPHSYVDQSNNPQPSYNDGALYPLAQTFTAGASGMLSGVDLDLFVGGAQVVPVDIAALNASGLPTGAPLASTAASLSVVGTSWVHFSFSTPPSVTKNAKYAIVFTTGLNTEEMASTDTYGGGQALWDDGGWASLSSPADFAFRTYLQDSATAKLQWDKSSITAGTSTQLTLTGTLTYLYGSDATGYSAALDSLPSWFDPATIVITCSWKSDCTLAGLEFGYIVGDTSGVATLTFNLVGTAKPLAADIGTPGIANGGGCLEYPAENVLVQPNQSDPGCADGAASLQVLALGATPAPTLPPTSTSARPASDNNDGMIWFLPFALVASIGGLLVLVDRRRRRLF